jgi:hypothetical protein
LSEGVRCIIIGDIGHAAIDIINGIIHINSTSLSVSSDDDISSSDIIRVIPSLSQSSYSHASYMRRFVGAGLCSLSDDTSWPWTNTFVRACDHFTNNYFMTSPAMNMIHGLYEQRAIIIGGNGDNSITAHDGRSFICGDDCHGNLSLPHIQHSLLHLIFPLCINISSDNKLAIEHHRNHSFITISWWQRFDHNNEQ